jgi:hypothetical protein
MARVSESWRRLIEAIRSPAAAGPFRPGDVSLLLKGAQADGMLPLLSDAWEGAGVLGALDLEVRRNFVQAALIQRAKASLLWEELGRVVDVLAGERLVPLLLKGAHLAPAYYGDVHLRPMDDVDLGFWDLDEARRAFDSLRQAGYDAEEQGLKGDPWAYDQHLAVLTHPRTRAQVEIHGSLIYAPRDQRWQRAAVLLEEREGASILGKNVWVLKPEANVVYLLAHLLVHHEAVPPTLIHIWDVGLILEKERGRFDWDRLVRLADHSGFGRSTALGLSMVRDVLGCEIPEKTLQVLGLEHGEQGTAQITGTFREELQTKRVLGQIAHARGVFGPVVMAFHMAFPPRAFLRERYPDKQHWPRPLLYPYRWGLQLWRVARYCLRLPV